MPKKPSGPPLSEAHLALGQYLKSLRVYQGLTTRQMGFSTSTVSNAETGQKLASGDLLKEYAVFCGGNKERADKLNRLYWAAVEAHMEAKNRDRNIESTLQRRAALLADLRLVMRKIEGEIKGFSQLSYSTYEKLDARIVARLADENEQLIQRLKDAGIPREWRESLRETYD